MAALPDGANQVGTFRADDFLFAISASHADDRQMLSQLLGDIRSDVPMAVSTPAYTFERAGDAVESWAIAGPRLDRYVTEDLGEAIGHLLAGINVATLDASPRQLHLHAAAATKNGQAVVIAAGRGTGKTTTVASLLSRGYSFLTDENVILDQKNTIRGVPRPLSIKPGGWQRIDLEVDAFIPATASDDAFRFVPVGRSGVEICQQAQACLVVMLRRTAAEPTEPIVENLHPADAVVALMQETLDAGRYGELAALRLAELATAARCVRVARGEPGRTAEVIDALVDQPPTPAREIIRYGPSDAINAQVVSFVIERRAVIHHLGSGRIMALDAVATEVWESIGGWRMHDHIALDGPIVSAFAGELRDHGLLAPAGGA